MKDWRARFSPAASNGCFRSRYGTPPNPFLKTCWRLRWSRP